MVELTTPSSGAGARSGTGTDAWRRHVLVAMLVACAIRQGGRSPLTVLGWRGRAQIALHRLVDLTCAGGMREIARQRQVEGARLRAVRVALACLGQCRHGKGQDGRDKEQAQAGQGHVGFGFR
ncbi:MAG: hypothetical protein BGP19_11590 [Thiobacillus sp. 0-1251]|nr:MAG: hypothetical protein ABT23_05110 [Thiobacillus sp. SCN 63-57]OJY55708.1 MAG: hypothetical protein BGP19_11590 [Thiobacillus sp. 0-1251]